MLNRPEIARVILTGGTETALKILGANPTLHLLAETGGKNATIVTDMADRDQAIKNVVHSAFSNCGQKCSATSLLILEKTIYDDPHFRQQLVDATASITTLYRRDRALSLRVREHLRAALPEHLALPALARRLFLSPRTLHRPSGSPTTPTPTTKPLLASATRRRQGLPVPPSTKTVERSWCSMRPPTLACPRPSWGVVLMRSAIRWVGPFT